MQRAGVDDRMSLILAAEDHQQVADHCRTSFVIEFDHLFVGQFRQSHLNHRDCAMNNFLPGGDHRFRLLSAQHCLGNFGGVGQVSEAGFFDNDAAFAKRFCNSACKSCEISSSPLRSVISPASPSS